MIKFLASNKLFYTQIFFEFGFATFTLNTNIAKNTHIEIYFQIFPLT